MITIGRYLVFMISLTGMTLFADDTFSEETIAQFLNYIFQLHNDVRDKHGVQPLVRTDELDAKASEKIDILFTSMYQNTNQYGMNYRIRHYKNDIELDTSEAEEFFSEWYNTFDEYNYFFEPLHRGYDQFTQIVWRNTKHIGMAFKSMEKSYLLLVYYYPSGNIKNNYTTNVMIPPSIAEARNPENNMLIYQGDEKRFLAYIWELHNAVRRVHGVKIILRKEYLDSKASELCKMNYKPKYSKYYEINTHVRYFHEDFKLDAAEAQAIFSEWYDKGANNDGNVALSNKYAASFARIIQKETEFFGIAMRRFKRTYRVVALYSPPELLQLVYINNVPQFRYMDDGESSVNN